MKNLCYTITILILLLLFSACAQNNSHMQDGYYTAEAASFDARGWKEYITIYVSDNQIVTVEYNAYNASGLIESWDMNDKRYMTKTFGTYPSEYMRAYSVSLLNWQNPAEVIAIPGAEHSHEIFQTLAEAAMAQARAGDKKVAFVELPNSQN